MKRISKTRAAVQDEHLPLLLSIPETGKQLGLGKDAIYERIRDGRLEAVDVAGDGCTATHLRVPLASIHAYIANLPRVHTP